MVPSRRRPGPEATPRFGYQGSLDGLRALAVTAVIAFHLGYSWAGGGFLSVDLFFLLSGFLITSLLIGEWRQSGSIRLRDFWGRRLRRLMPAVVLVVVGVAVLTRLEIDPWSRTAIRSDALASLLYVANWRFIAAEQGYFQVFAAPSPLRHMWTLAIEEQFYLVWPLVSLAALRLGRGSLRVLGGVCVAGIAASVVAMAATFTPGDPLRAYYGTDSRAHTILAGALLAVVLTARPPSPATGRRLAVVGLPAVAAMLVTWTLATGTSSRYYHGGSALYAALGCVVVASALQPGPLQRVLAWRPIAWLGRLSYGLYVFHWPVIVWLVPTRVGIDGLALDALRLAVTLGTSVLSYYLVERPIRERRMLREGWPRERWLVAAGAIVAVAALVVSAGGATPPPSYLAGERPAPADMGPAVDSTGSPAVAAQPVGDAADVAPGSAAATDDGTWHLGDPLFCGTPRPEEVEEAEEAASDGGPIDVPAPADGMRILLVGDSTACSLKPGLVAVGESVGAEVVEASVFGCGVASGEITTTRGEQITPNSHRCPAMVDMALDEATAAGPPDVVVWMSIWEKSDLIVDGEVLASDTDEGREAMLDRMDAALERVAGTAPVALVTVAAPAPNDAAGADNTSNEVDDASYARLDAVLRAFAERHPDQVHVVDMAERLCPGGPPCPEEVDGEVLRPDGRHLTPAASAEQSRWLVPRLVELAS